MDTMIHIAAIRDTEQADCIVKWYYTDKKAERNTLILALMEKYSDFVPSSIMISLVEQACGDFRKG